MPPETREAVTERSEARKLKRREAVVALPGGHAIEIRVEVQILDTVRSV
jgi:hypothetical protein